MINFNGELKDSDLQLSVFNRSFLYGDGVFETLKIVNNRILFFEEHYFRLMASMRILRMNIPMTFTLEYLEYQILMLAKAKNYTDSARARLTVYRNDNGLYLPNDNNVSFVIHIKQLEQKKYFSFNEKFEVDMYKDFSISKQLLSTLKTTNKIIQVTASIYAKENELDSCLMINESKNVVEAIYGNLFMLSGTTLITPPLTEGCLNGIMRKQIISLVKKFDSISIVEEPISPFDLQKADELFITNVIIGIQPITKYRKKEYSSKFSKHLIEKLNEIIED